PLPLPEDRLLFVLVYLKQNPLQVLLAWLFGLTQPKAHQWLHVLLPVLLDTLRTHHHLPAGGQAQLSASLHEAMVREGLARASPEGAAASSPLAETPETPETLGADALPGLSPPGADVPSRRHRVADRKAQRSGRPTRLLQR
ncbi:MAG: transposase family protein, partial [Candidatus Competibacterales bacterium]